MTQSRKTLTLASAQPSVSRTSSCTQTHSGLHLHFCFSPTVSELAMHLISEAALIIIATWLFYKVRPHSENQYKLSFTEPVQSGLLWNVNSPSERSLVTDSFFFQSEHSGNPDWIQSHCWALKFANCDCDLWFHDCHKNSKEKFNSQCFTMFTYISVFLLIVYYQIALLIFISELILFHLNPFSFLGHLKGYYIFLCLLD